jgi:superfamily II DNA helicase RecQ
MQLRRFDWRWDEVSITRKMQTYKQTFELWRPCQVAVCKQCHVVVLPSATASHMYGQHGYLDAATRKSIIRIAKELCDNGTLCKTAAEIQYPEPTQAPHPLLETYTDAKKCIVLVSDDERCGKVFQTVKAMQRHLRAVHDWDNPRKRGGRPGQASMGGKDTVWVSDVWCQRMGKTGALQRWFEVRPQAEEAENEGGEQDEDARLRAAIAQSFVGAAEMRKEEMEAKKAIEAQAEKSSDTWVAYTKWPSYLRGFDRQWLVDTLRAPEELESGEDMVPEDGEMQLAMVLLAISRVVWRAQRVCDPLVIGSAVLEIVERRETGAMSNEKRFYSGQQGSTIKKYLQTVTAVVAFIWRTHFLEPISHDEDDERDEAGVQDRRPGYVFTPGQARTLQRVQEAAIRCVRWYASPGGHSGSEDEGSTANGSESDDDGMLSPGGRQAASMERLEKRVLSFYISVLHHNIGSSEFQSALLSGLAVLGCQPGGGWSGPSQFTPKLSAIVTTAKMMVVYKAKMDREEELEQAQAARGMTRQEAELDEGIASHFTRVQGMVRTFMVLIDLVHGSYPTPMNTILRMRAYGRRIHDTENAPGVIDWHGDRLLYQQEQFDMDTLRAMIHGLVEEAWVQLREDVLFVQWEEGGVVLPAIDWSCLVDNPAEEETGWSFVEDPRNHKALGNGVYGPRWLEERFVKEKGLATRLEAVERRPGPAVWRTAWVAAYRDALSRFRKALLVLVHMTGGQPARGTELVTVRYRNAGGKGETRGLFIEDGLVVLMTQYHKGLSTSGKQKVVHRYVPREVGELVVYYIWLALPFWYTLVRVCVGKGAADESDYIWEPAERRAWALPELEDVFASRAPKRTEQDQQPTVEVDDWASDEDEEDEGGEEETAGAGWWQMERWGTQAVTKALHEASIRHMGARLGVLAWRHTTKAIFRKFIGSQRVETRQVVGADEMAEDEEDGRFQGSGDPFDRALHMQAGHGLRVGDGIYGRGIQEAHSSTPGQRGLFRQVSQAWHRWLFMPSAMEEAAQGRGDRSVGAMMASAQEVQRRRWKRMQRVDVQAQLEGMVGKGAQFRSVQKPALQAIMAQESPVVVVMGTGAGKSVLFMLPAYCAGGEGMTVVVVPLLSLRADMRARCEAIGIRCVEWSAARPHDEASVVLVTPEAAVSSRFAHFVNRVRAMGRLERVVIDECHVVLETAGGWREKMLSLRALVYAETQMVYLTATLAPEDEESFRGIMGLRAGEGRWFRGSTTRTNVRYGVRRYVRGRETEAAVLKALVEEKRRWVGQQGQIVVYCDSRRKVEEYAKTVGGIAYHARIGDAGKKKGIVQALVQGNGQVFTTTNALGLGVDAPRIRVVIHVGTVRQLRAYAQESGRAGRDGLRSEAEIIYAVGGGHARKRQRADTSGQRVEAGMTAEEAAAKGIEQGMFAFVEAAGCMRVVLDRQMDGRRDRAGCESGEEACYRCEEARGPASALAYRAASGQQIAAREVMRGVASMEEEEEGAPGAATAGVPMAAEVEEVQEDVAFAQELARRRMRADRVRGEEMAEQEDGVAFARMVTVWRQSCAWCMAKGSKAEARGHTLRACQAEEAEDIRADVADYWDEIRRARWESYSGCHACGLPWSICRHWEVAEGQNGYRPKRGVCQEGDTLVDVLASAISGNDSEGVDSTEERLASLMGEDGHKYRDSGYSEKLLFQWLVRKRRWGGFESNNMCWALFQLYHENKTGGGKT